LIEEQKSESGIKNLGQRKNLCNILLYLEENKMQEFISCYENAQT
jgi:hypothetical protein